MFFSRIAQTSGHSRAFLGGPLLILFLLSTVTMWKQQPALRGNPAVSFRTMPLFVTIARLPWQGGLLALALAAGTRLPAAADEPPPPGGYPSWADVQEAKSSEAAKAAEIATINGLLTDLE